MKFNYIGLELFKKFLMYGKFNGFFLLIFFCLFVNDGHEENEFRIYSNGEAFEVCDYYVLKQKIYLSKTNKVIINKWSSRYYLMLNKYIRGLISSSSYKCREYERFRKDLSDLINSTTGLKEDTLLFRGEKDVDVQSRFVVGQSNKFFGFISTSFSIKTARNFSKSKEGNSYVIAIKAKYHTKGIAIDGIHMGSFNNQKEWLLDENLEYITESIDEKNKIIVVKLI